MENSTKQKITVAVALTVAAGAGILTAKVLGGWLVVKPIVGKVGAYKVLPIISKVVIAQTVLGASITSGAVAAAATAVAVDL